MNDKMRDQLKPLVIVAIAITLMLLYEARKPDETPKPTTKQLELSPAEVEAAWSMLKYSFKKGFVEKLMG